MGSIAISMKVED